MLQGYLKFALATWIAVKAMQEDGFKKETKQELTNSIMTCIFAVYIVTLPAIVYTFLNKNKEKLADEKFKEKFESLYLNIDVDTDNSLDMTTLFLLRRLFFSLLVIFLPNTCTQLLVMVLSSLLMISFIISVKPLSEPYLNRMEIFNESTLLVSTYFMFLFTDFVDDAEMRSKLGWAYIGVIGTMIVVNFGCMIVKVF
jgi:hypothetical protein